MQISEWLKDKTWSCVLVCCAWYKALASLLTFLKSLTPFSKTARATQARPSEEVPRLVGSSVQAKEALEACSGPPQLQRWAQSFELLEGEILVAILL